MSGIKHSQPPSFILILLRAFVLALTAVMLLLVFFLSWPELVRRFHRGTISGELSAAAQGGSDLLEPLFQPSQSPTPTQLLGAQQTPIAVESLSEPSLPAMHAAAGTAFLSILDGAHTHLFAFLPDRRSFLRLSMGDWDDLTPAVSPNGSYLAFASNRSSQWDLYLMSLQDGSLSQLTSTPDYESSPSWSSDGLWLAYESYISGEENPNLDIWIRPLDPSQQPIRLTTNPWRRFLAGLVAKRPPNCLRFRQGWRPRYLAGRPGQDSRAFHKYQP